MASLIQELMLAAFASNALHSERLEGQREVYERSRHRILGIAFWMTDNELAAEGLFRRTIRRALDDQPRLTTAGLDRALIAELRTVVPLGTLTLECVPPTHRLGVRYNTLRIHLERAVVQLPPTERLVFVLHDVEGYGHDRIADLLGLSAAESQLGLHQARLRLRELVADMEISVFAAAC